MKIAVCIKQVPTRDWQPRLNDAKTWIREQDASYEMNEPDAYALEEALRLKEKHGGEVVVCSAGPARVAQVIREALARGADRAIHVEDDGLASADAFVVAEALAAAMKDEQFDLILTGLQSDDQGFAQTGVILAERLGLPHATIIMEVQAEPAARCASSASSRAAGSSGSSMPLPAVLTIQSGINQLRYATLKGIMAAKKKEIRKAAAPRRRGQPRQKIVSLYVPEKTKKTQIIAGLAGRSGEGAGAPAARGSAGDRVILVDRANSAAASSIAPRGKRVAGAQQLAAGEPDRRSRCLAPPATRSRRSRRSSRPRAGAGSRHARERRARAVHAGRLHRGAAGGDRRSCRRRSCCCRTPTRRATSRRSSRRAWTARSSPT